MSVKTYKKLQVVNLTTDFENAIEIVKAEIPIPGRNELLIKNHYVGINASDITVTGGAFGEPPFDIGFESLGVVESVGENVNLKPGQPVLYMGTKAYGEYVLAQKKQVLAVPEVKPQFLALLIAGLTAGIALDEDGIDVVWETIGGTTAEMLFKHLATRGRMIIVGGISGSKHDGMPPFHPSDLSAELLFNSKTVAGFMLPQFSEKFDEYLNALILKYFKGELKLRIDCGEKSSDGPFRGLKGIAKAVK
ncbi:uncharacterized protein B4U79_01281, partial [Dinothrombium tinctorium]